MDNNKTWEALSMKDRASFIKLAMQNGYRDLDSIRSLYNNKSKEDAEGFSRWKKQIKNYKGIDVDNDNTYDYRGFYFDNPDNAWKLLEDRPDVHFTDKFKTSKHPTFSNESIYSGVKHQYNPNGIKGGKWLDDYNYIMSDDMLKASNYDISNTRKYLDEAESQHVNVYAPDGSIVMEPITVTNKYATGGPINDYNAMLYNGEIVVPIEEISITGKSSLTEYKPGDKRYIDQIRKFTDRIYKGELAIDAVPKYYRRGVENTLRGDQFANKVRKSRDENYEGLMTIMNTLPLAAGAAAVLPPIPTNKVIKGVEKIKNIYTKYIPKPVRVGIKTAWDGFSTYDTVTNLDNRLYNIKDDFSKGKIGSGLFNMALVTSDLFGIADGLISRINKPSVLGTLTLNKRLPHNKRKEIWENAVNYNNLQLANLGLDPLTLPYNPKAIHAASIKEELANVLGKMQFSTGPGRGLAWAKGEIGKDLDITFPFLVPKTTSLMETPESILAHEIRHGIQKTFGKIDDTTIPLSIKYTPKYITQKRLADFSNPNLNYYTLKIYNRGRNLYHEALDLSSFNTKRRRPWVKSLNEFDAEMAAYRQAYNLNIPYHNWEFGDQMDFIDFASKRFGISDDLADKIAEKLSLNGYALGGPLYNQDNPIEAFQGNPYIPIVRY